MASVSGIPHRPPASSESGIGKHLLLVFLACVGFYIACFTGVESWRQRRGPWRITFGATAGTNPTIRISQAKLGIHDVRIQFIGAAVPEGSLPQTVSFTGPDQQSRVPFGQVRFLDTTFLPGTVTLEVFGHEIELLPRVLIVDKDEHPWRNGTRLELQSSRPKEPQADR